MPRRILVIVGHPDPDRRRLAYALADAYAEAAATAGQEVRRIEIASLDIPCLRAKSAFDSEPPAPPFAEAQAAITWSEHIVFIYPLWLGTMPALLKAFLEQVFRPGFAFTPRECRLWTKGLRGRSARIVVTMGMPAFFYRWYYRAHSLKSLERNILGVAGIGPIRETLFGMVEDATGKRPARVIATLRLLGARGA
ncbi:MAG: flavodoxin family protein [Alphaproteobacteria bacterium]|nr:flavodoxin family protein [Alphaproteobacteria bacterium]